MRAIKIRPQSSEQLQALDELYRTTKDARLRQRAQMILLAAEQKQRSQAIAEIVRKNERTVRRWLKRYSAEGIEGLKSRPRPGKPRKVTIDYRDKLMATVRRRPRSLGQPYSLWSANAWPAVSP